MQKRLAQLALETQLRSRPGAGQQIQKIWLALIFGQPIAQSDQKQLLLETVQVLHQLRYQFTWIPTPVTNRCSVKCHRQKRNNSFRLHHKFPRRPNSNVRHWSEQKRLVVLPVLSVP